MDDAECLIDGSMDIPGTKVGPETGITEYKSLKARWQDRTCNDIIQWLGQESIRGEFNAMVNSRPGGTIHFGVDDKTTQIEEGMALTSEERNKISIAISQTFWNFFPSPDMSAYDVQFIKMRPTDSEDETERYRFDVIIKPTGGVHFMSRSRTIVYRRSGPQKEPMQAEMLGRKLRDNHDNNDMIIACLDAQMILRIRDAQREILSCFQDKDKAEKILKQFVGIFDNYEHGGKVVAEMLHALEQIACLTRHSLPLDIAYTVCSMAEEIFLVRRDELSERDIHNLQEINFNVAYDGIKYRKDLQLFQWGCTRLSKLLGYENVRERFESLKETVGHCGLEEKDKNRCRKYLELLEQMASAKDYYSRTKFEDEIWKLGMTY